MFVSFLKTLKVKLMTVLLISGNMYIVCKHFSEFHRWLCASLEECAPVYCISKECMPLQDCVPTVYALLGRYCTFKRTIYIVTCIVRICAFFRTVRLLTTVHNSNLWVLLSYILMGLFNPSLDYRNLNVSVMYYTQKETQHEV